MEESGGGGVGEKAVFCVRMGGKKRVEHCAQFVDKSYAAVWR